MNKYEQVSSDDHQMPLVVGVGMSKEGWVRMSRGVYPGRGWVCPRVGTC